MATIAVDTFLTGGRGTPNAWSPGSDGSNWAQSRGNQTLTYDGTGHQGQMTYNGSGTLGIMTYTTQTPGNCEILFNTDAGALTDIIGGILCFQDPSNFYYCDLGNVAQTFEIGVNATGNAFHQLVSTGFTYITVTPYSMRFQIRNGTLKAKVWRPSMSSEPDWMLSIADGTFSSGKFGVCSAPSLAMTDTFDTFSANDTQNNRLFVSDGMGGQFS